MKKVLFILLCLVFVASVVEAKIVSDSIYQIPKTKIPPVIDGLQDQVWKTIDWNPQRYYTVDGPPADSGAGLSGLTKALWDANNLYILFYSIDNNIIDIPANPGWNQDAIEIYIDGSNDHSTETALKAGQYQFTIPHWLKGQEVGHLGTAFGTVVDTTGIEFKIVDVPDTVGFPGFMTEVKIPLAALGIDGSTADQVIGWELQEDNAVDATAGRANMSKWWSPSNLSWANAGIWGYAKLDAREVDTVLQVVNVGTAPTIDGTMDAVYKQANAVTMNLFRVGDPPGADPANTDPVLGGFVTAYPVYDATNIYLFLDVVDQVITPIPANPSWNQDAVEIYFDGTNDHTDETALKAGQYQFTIPQWYIGTEAGRLGGAFGTVVDTTGMEFKIVTRDTRTNETSLVQEGAGYNVEIKLPLAALGIDGSTTSPFGFELQLDNSNDATAGRQGMEKWWNASNMSWANAGIWGYAQLGAVTGVEKIDRNGPKGYALYDAYPNPFNPSTKITFELAKTEKVKLAVYNLLGEQVSVLINGVMSAGSHPVTFNASNLASGVYFYRLEAGGTTIAKKMVLLK